MCSYQPDTLTVRASFSVPSKSGLSSMSDNGTDRESRTRHFKMVGKEALLLQKELKFENLSDEQLGNNIPNTAGFNGDISEIYKQKGINDHKSKNATFDRLVYGAESPINEGILF